MSVNLTDIDLACLAKIVDEAAYNGAAIEQLSKQFPTLTESDGYDIQQLSIEHRLARGEKRIGMKMGLTSKEKMRQVGVNEVIWGRLTDAMLVEEGGEFCLSHSIHPRIEPEIAFLIGKPLTGNVSILEAQNAITAIAPAMEIIDSRYANFQFNLADVVADNASSSALVIGDWCPPHTDIANLGMTMRFNGKIVQSGSSATILGSPIRSLVKAAKMCAAAGETLKPGDIVLAGAATEALALKPNVTICTQVQNMGSVSLTVIGEKQ